MGRSTVGTSGVGRIFIETEKAEISLCGAVAADGSPVNCVSRKVSRNKAHEAEAAKNEEKFSLKEVSPGVFLLAD